MAFIDFSLDSRVKKQHVPLASQQRHLRHIKCICARNICTSTSHKEDGSSGSVCSSLKSLDEETHEIGYYFTLHNLHDEEALYQSEVSYSSNPSWRNVDGSSFKCSSTSQIMIRVYYCETPKRESISPPASLLSSSLYCSSPTRRQMKLQSSHSLEAYLPTSTLFLEWKVHLSGLVFVAEEIPKENRFKENTIMFGFMEGFYTSHDSIVTSRDEKRQLQSDVNASQESMQVTDLTQMRNSYCLNILYRIEMVQRVINQTLSLVNNTRSDLEEKLQSLGDKNELQSQVECVQMSVRNVQNEIDKLKEKRTTKCEMIAKNENDICEKGIDMLNKFQEIKADRERLNEKKQKIIECREKLVKTKYQLAIKRRRFISELVKVYPIMPFPDGKGYSICGVYLPNSEDFDGRDELMISIALGYVSHLLVLIHRTLDLPMRYQIHYCGSRSTIYDHINDKITGEDRTFPLHAKSGKHKLHFRYGVFLLNKAIAQLRQYFGLSTRDLRATLPNLYNLLQEKLVISDDETDHAEMNNSARSGRSNSVLSNVDDYLRRELEVMKHDIELSQPSTSQASSSSVNNNSFKRTRLLSERSSSKHPLNVLQTTSDHRSISRSLDKGLNEIVVVKKVAESESESSTSSSSHVYPSSIPKHVKVFNSSTLSMHQNLSESELDQMILQNRNRNRNSLLGEEHSQGYHCPSICEDELNGLSVSSAESSPRLNTRLSDSRAAMSSSQHLPTPSSSNNLQVSTIRDIPI